MVSREMRSERSMMVSKSDQLVMGYKYWRMSSVVVECTVKVIVTKI